ncbi:hypothetical protein D9M71_636460 [compost metagenome]
MAKMWMIRGESGRLYDEFRERRVVAIGCRNGSRSQAKYVAKGNYPAVSDRYQTLTRNFRDKASVFT